MKRSMLKVAMICSVVVAVPFLAVAGFDGCDLASVKASAEKGDAEAMVEVGRRYRNGMGVKKDGAEAAKWTIKAASNGCERAVGLCYEFGYGVVKDAAEAVKWYRKAAEQGDSRAQCNLGWRYENGEGVVKDAAEAVKWYRKAAEQGDSRAQCNLGWRYENGEGVERDVAEAVKWYRKAAEQGDAEAQRYLGWHYAHGEGVVKDAAEAVKWCRKAAEQGDADAQCILGDHMLAGVGIAKDAAEAVKWYKRSADQGNVYGQFSLGWCYETGKGVEKDMAEAVKLYQKAAEQEYVLAHFHMKNHERLIILMALAYAYWIVMLMLLMIYPPYESLGHQKWKHLTIYRKCEQHRMVLAALALLGVTGAEIYLIYSGADLIHDVFRRIVLGGYLLEQFAKPLQMISLLPVPFVLAVDYVFVRRFVKWLKTHALPEWASVTFSQYIGVQIALMSIWISGGMFLMALIELYGYTIQAAILGLLVVIASIVVCFPTRRRFAKLQSK